MQRPPRLPARRRPLGGRPTRIAGARRVSPRLPAPRVHRRRHRRPHLRPSARRRDPRRDRRPGRAGDDDARERRLRRPLRGRRQARGVQAVRRLCAHERGRRSQPDRAHVEPRGPEADASRRPARAHLGALRRHEEDRGALSRERASRRREPCSGLSRRSAAVRGRPPGRHDEGDAGAERHRRHRHRSRPRGRRQARAAAARALYEDEPVSFASPIVLLALIVPALAVIAYVWGERKPTRYVVPFPNLSVLASVATRSSSWRRHLVAAALLAAVALLCIGAARPKMTLAATQDRASVVLVLDVSGSMAAQDVKPTRLEAARGAIRRFLRKLPAGVRVGVVAFSNTPEVVTVPTTDRERVSEGLEILLPQS
ncbi:MAG: VWA domain-containing protein, partial [Actinobacteria bacterium]|nr:VWA domain-containing protein [Actinomycetota bacterium]